METWRQDTVSLARTLSNTTRGTVDHVMDNSPVAEAVMDSASECASKRRGKFLRMNRKPDSRLQPTRSQDTKCVGKMASLMLQMAGKHQPTTLKKNYTGKYET
ncbi:hypothetical protein E2C01_064977 [Portunus trituberculatus]|uniref:Uncharacterized protein n=1 Tax=Portunus trituberculatus TaxID=210409 RepID=A0A5B7HQH9_PORTR|nr:hypothetical protein [Portunus trituberculatus]